MWARTLSRPRCAIPITTSCAPPSAPSSIASSSIGTSASRPSIENCFWPMNARRRYVSNASTCARRSEQLAALLGVERPAEAARLDRLAEPDALRVVRDVLDLVRDRARVDLAQAREGLEQRLARDVQPEHARGDPRLELGRQRRAEALGSSSAGSPGGSEPSGSRRASEVAVRADTPSRATSRRRRRRRRSTSTAPRLPRARARAARSSTSGRRRRGLGGRRSGAGGGRRPRPARRRCRPSAAR